MTDIENCKMVVSATSIFTKLSFLPFYCGFYFYNFTLKGEYTVGEKMPEK